MMFFEKDGSSKGWPWQSVARFFARRGPVCAVRKTSRQARRASFIVFYLVNIKNRGSFRELRFKSRGEVSALRRSMCAVRMMKIGSTGSFSSVLSVKI